MCWRRDVGIFKDARVELSEMGTRVEWRREGQRDSIEMEEEWNLFQYDGHI